MKTKVSPTIVGIFVSGAIVLSLIALVSFGNFNFFSKPQRFVVFFKESVHGLDLGSPVKLRGVRIGRVSNLELRTDPKLDKPVVAVTCEFNRDAISDAKGKGMDVGDAKFMQAEVDKGLRAQLAVSGLATGLLFVELDYVADPTLYPQEIALKDPNYFVVPSMPSSILELQASVDEVLAKFKQIDFNGISVELKGLLVSTRKQIDGVDLKALASQWTEAGRSINTLMAGPEVKQAFVNLDSTLSDLRRVLTRLDRQIGTTGAGLDETLAQAKETLESFNASAVTARRFIAAQNGLGEEAARALSKLGDAAESVQNLADFLERNPNALLSGKKGPK